MTIRLVVGLGNPGEGYRDTRHNVGFRVVDELATRRGGRWHVEDLNEVAVLDGGLLLAKPQAFMNRSGAALESLLTEHELDIGEVLVVVDDVDLPLGRVRLRRRGGPGTHNGLRDICHRFGRGFPRARVGVGGEDPVEDLAAYVLSPFTEAERALVAEVVERTVAAVEVALTEGVAEAMNRFNRAPQEDEGEAAGSEE